MIFNWLNRYMPRGIYGRAALILLAPIIALQIVVSLVFIERHYEDVARQMTNSMVLELQLLLDALNSGAGTPDQTFQQVARLSEPLQIEMMPAGRNVPTADSRIFYDLSGDVVIDTLRSRIEQVQVVDLATDSRRLNMWVMTDIGLVHLSVGRHRLSASNPHQFLVLMVIVGAIMAVVAIVFLRNQMRPIRKLAQAAEAFGKGRIDDFSASGASEVRSAGNAFLDMRGRIERQIEQRTMMLSGVSHDLRTPITRLKLGLSMMGDSGDIQALKRDVRDMERLLDEFLDFARSDALDDQVKADPARLLADIVEKIATAGGDVRLGEVLGDAEVMLRPVAVERALDNLIGNALRYGDQARASLTVTNRAVKFSIEDDGPGIARERREEALRPFARLDVARNQDKGSGVGLGLAIANDIARQHGGALRLGESQALGGLQVDLILAR